MGSELDNMAFRSILVAIAIIVAGVHAVPMPNDIVPETKFVEGAATSVHAAANQIVTEMIQAGRDWTSCEELANSTREEVTDAVKTTQKLLDSADKGCSCAGLGQDEVNRTLNEMNAAWIMTDAAYLSAYAIYTKAVNTLATARKTYALSVIAHKEAVTEAARLKLECECATQSAHATAWAEANEDNDANAAAWAQAHHIDCVVQSISEANCVFGPVPGLTKPTLCDDIESVSCAAESGSAQHVPADEEPVYIEPCPLDMPNCGEQEAIATLTEGRTGSSGEQCFSYSCPPPPALTPPPSAPPVTCSSCIPPKDKGCVFPFILKGVQHDTPVESVSGVGEGGCWCSTKVAGIVQGKIPTFNRKTLKGWLTPSGEPCVGTSHTDPGCKYHSFGYPVDNEADTWADLDGVPGCGKDDLTDPYLNRAFYDNI